MVRMPSDDWRLGFSERQRRFKHRLSELRERVQDSLCYAFDKLLQERMDTYFVVEERLEEFEKLFEQIAGELDEVTEIGGLERLEKRFFYLEDSFEETDAGLRGRPARFRHRFRFSDFFRRWQEQQSAPEKPPEIRDAAEAYEVLGVSTGSDLKTVRAAFRRMVKTLHPDRRDGDRSEETRLRKILAAYQFLKDQGRSA